MAAVVNLSYHKHTFHTHSAEQVLTLKGLPARPPLVLIETAMANLSDCKHTLHVRGMGGLHTQACCTMTSEITVGQVKCVEI